MLKKSSFFSNLLMFSVLLALIVIVLGAYTRLSDAGLGCPDWPGCYGQISVPEKLTTNEFERPLESEKAWKEMIHRYVAGTLGILILVILLLVIGKMPKIKQSLGLPIILLCTVTFQALLGMWTVTMLLSPVIVSAHLLGGLTTLSLLWWLLLNQIQNPHHHSNQNNYSQNNHPALNTSKAFKVSAVIALILLLFQILLGGWTSSNYAALACGVDFPTCATKWWPEMDFVNGFDFTLKPGINYEFGILDSPARTAIQFVHRIGALVVFIYLSSFALSLFKTHKGLAITLLIVLFTQITLGIMNVVLALPLEIAVMHNLVATFLLLTVLTINHRLLKTSFNP